MGFARLHKFFTPYNADQLGGLAFAQTANTMYFAHVDRPVHKLTREDHTEWSFGQVAFGPTISPPAAPTVAATSPNMTGYVATTYNYRVTGVSDDLGQESHASPTGSVANDLTLDGNYNTISWTTDPAYSRYNVYKESNGVYGYIGGTEGASFRDGTPVVIADLSDTPPVGYDPFDSDGNYPSAITFHQQRLFFAATRNLPNAFWASRTADPENLDRSKPIARPDDGFNYAILAKKVNSITQLFSSTSLFAMTTDSLYSLKGEQDGALVPGGVVPRRESGQGISRLPVIDVDDVSFFRPIQGSSVRALGYSFEIEGFRSNNVTIFSPHLFATDQIVSWTYQGSPFSCVWAAMASGRLLCFTWEREQEVWGWTVCETDGLVERVAAISEGGEDRLYAVITRQFGNTTRRFWERMALPHRPDNFSSACYLDCAVTQVFEEPTTEIGKLWHLEGQTVNAFYDGFAEIGLVVEDGMIRLPEPGLVVTVGLPYVAEIETLPMVMATQGGTKHTDRQTVASAKLRTIDTKDIEVAVTGAEFQPIAHYEDVSFGTVPDISTRDYEVPLESTWSDGATLTVRQTNPYPMHITGLFLEPDVGDD